MIEKAHKALLFAGRIAPTTKRGPRTVVVNTLRPCWLPEELQRTAIAVEMLLRSNFNTWMLEAPAFKGIDGSANFRVYATPQGIDVVVSAPVNGRLFDASGRISVCARVGWWIRDKLRSVKLASPEDLSQSVVEVVSC